MELGLETTDARTETPELDSRELYWNRELSWLQFNERVLELAEDESIPLLERVKFLAIYASNLDEFYMVRVAGLHDQVDAGIDDRKADGLSPMETIERVAERPRELGDRHSREWEERLRPALGGLGSPLRPVRSYWVRRSHSRRDSRFADCRRSVRSWRRPRCQAPESGPVRPAA